MGKIYRVRYHGNASSTGRAFIAISPSVGAAKQAGRDGVAEENERKALEAKNIGVVGFWAPAEAFPVFSAMDIDGDVTTMGALTPLKVNKVDDEGNVIHDSEGKPVLIDRVKLNEDNAVVMHNGQPIVLQKLTIGALPKGTRIAKPVSNDKQVVCVDKL